MTNPPSPRFTGLIRDVKTSKRFLQQTFSQVFFSLLSFFFLHHPSRYFPHSPQQQHEHQQVHLKNNHLHQELVHHQ